MKASITALAALAIFAAPATHAASNLLVNGDFETGDLTGWQTNGSPAGHLVEFDAETSSYVFVELAYLEKGFIGQQVNTKVGGTYTLEFDLFVGDDGGPGNSSEVDIRFHGTPVFEEQSVSHGWKHVVIGNLVAEYDVSALWFGNRNYLSNNRMDNISFSEVAAPVPEAQTYGMMLAGLGLMGLVARGRKA